MSHAVAAHPARAGRKRPAAVKPVERAPSAHDRMMEEIDRRLAAMRARSAEIDERLLALRRRLG